MVPAPLAGATEHLNAYTAERYRFVIGVSQTEAIPGAPVSPIPPIVFVVNVLGEATAGPCDQPSGPLKIIG